MSRAVGGGEGDGGGRVLASDVTPDEAVHSGVTSPLGAAAGLRPGPGGPPRPRRVMAPGRVRISFPRHAPALLDSLNRLRLQGKFCDVAVHAGGRVFAAHGSVLAAASPFFHDKLLLHAGPRLALPPAVDAGAFEGLLELIYCGRLTVAAEALPGHLLVASALQMWHVVERCSQILRELEGARAGHGCGGALASAGNVSGHDGSSASTSARNIHGHDGSSASTSARNVCGHDEASASSLNVRGPDGSSSSSSSRNVRGHDEASALSLNVRGPDGSLSSSSSSSSSSRNVRGHDGSSSLWNICDGHESIRGLDGSSRAVHGHEGSSSSLWVSHGQEGSQSSSLSRAIHGREESLSSWNIHDGDESICGLDGSIHDHDGSLRAIHGLDGSLPSSSSSLRTIRGHEGSSLSLSRTVRVRDGPSSLWNVHDEDESIRGLDGHSPSSSSSKAVHGYGGSLPSSSSSLQTNHSQERASLSSKASHGHEGSPLSSSRTIRGPSGSSRANRSGERSSSSSPSLWTLHGGPTAPRLNRGGKGPSSSSSWGSHDAEGTIHGDIRAIHGGDGTIHGDIVTIHDDSGTIHGDIVTVHGDNDPSSSWATCATTEELLQLHVATTTSPSLPSQEILKIRVGGDDDNDDDKDHKRLPPDTATAAALPMPPDPPAIFYIKPEPAAATATTPDIPPPTEPPVLPGWTPVDLHGNELPRRGGQPAHAPVKLGTAPADGKRFGCACGKRFAARPKRDRHILLTLSLRPFACARCPKRFKLKHHLGEHMKTHRADRGRGHGGRGAAGDQYGPVRTGTDQYGAVLGV
ncbi:hornerin-like isoform X2 [Prinia subflava]|uniref:hornerin-like isoform X2 n=1 Tax=Prinia subflava TaxID=208062 RepID=UPI002FE1E15A